MTRLLLLLLTLLFSLSGPAMGEFSDFGQSSNAARWRPGASPHAPTRAGNAPSDRTVTRREWKNEATSPTRGDYSTADMERMRQGLPPQRYNPDKGGIESMEH